MCVGSRCSNGGDRSGPSNSFCAVFTGSGSTTTGEEASEDEATPVGEVGGDGAGVAAEEFVGSGP